MGFWCAAFTLFAVVKLTTASYEICSDVSPEICRENVEFHLYTRRNPEEPHKIIMDEYSSVQMSQFKKENPTVIYIHGYLEWDHDFSTSAIKKAYLSKGDYNVLVVDWSRLSSFPYTQHAVPNVPGVGKYVAQFLHFLILNGGLSLDTLHVIGFSLGAHVAGFIGKNMKAGERLPRITGLDPAYPDISITKNEYHLWYSDAVFVDVIHTDGGGVLHYGFQIPLGHADFYPNGGTPPQPGCTIAEYLPLVAVCSHNRAWEYYVESVKSEKAFQATACKDYYHYKDGNCSYGGHEKQQYMGIAAHPRSQGRFYFETNDAAPYGRSSS